MVKNIFVRNGFILGILFLMLFSSISPFVVGYNEETIEEQKLIDKNAFYNSDKHDFSKTPLFKKSYLIDYSNGDNKPNDLKIKIKSNPRAPNGPKDTPWPMKCHDNRHTSLSPYSTSNTTQIEIWRFRTSIRAEDSPAIDSDGTIYFGSWDRYLYALYPNGKLKWKYKTDGNIYGSTPAIDEDGTIYVGTWGWGLYAINPNGTKKWRFGAGDTIASSPAIADDGTIYFGIMGPGNNGRIWAINPNGTAKWYYDTGYWIASDPAIGDDGTIYIGSFDSYLYAMNPNGTLKWRFKTGDEIHSHPSIADDGTIYFGSNDKKLYALYPNGTMKWKFSLPSGLYNSAAIGEDGIIYVADFYQYAIYPNGTLKWIYDYGPITGVGRSSPAISADGTIYVGTWIGNNEGGEIIAINSDGTEQWRKKITGRTAAHVDSSPCIGKDGTVYICSYSHVEYAPNEWLPQGSIHAFGPQSTNEPPNTPTVEGQTIGRAGEEYGYYFTSVDPDNNPVSFYIEWGDGSNSGWTIEVASDERTMFKHIFSEQGEYTIRAKAIDTFGEESGWGELTVTMPRNKMLYNSLFLRFLERFPLLERLLNLR